MRIVFVGSVDFSLHCLNEIVANNGEVIAVLTLPKNLAGVHSDFVDLSEIAAQHGIPVYKLQKKITVPENVDLIKTLKPDIIFVCGWSQLISKAILDIPPRGCIGTHPSLLPMGRGRHPLIWALVKGLEESGLTFFYIDEGADTGDILWQEPFPIAIDDNASTLYKKIKSLASKAIQEFFPQLEQGTAPRIAQDDSRATTWRKRTEKDGEIDWESSTIEIYNLIRALTHPYVGANTYFRGKKLLVWRTQIPKLPSRSESKLNPGMVIKKADDHFEVRTGDGSLVITDYDFPEDHTISIGDQLGIKP
ncbi:MAG: methionyl-tRNA formyltransferase [Candidatus Thorarchaeota archaeon]